jgi:VWFA-related protein
MRNLLTPSVMGLVAASTLVMGANATTAAQVAAEGSRTVHVTVIDKKGEPVTDLRAAEFEVKVGGKKLEVVTAETARAPMRVALVVSDAGSGGFQGGLANFIQRLSGHAEVALVSLVVQPEIIVDYSSDSSVLRAGLRRLGPRGLQRGAQLLETIQDATKHVRREGTRPVIVVVRVGGEASTALSGKEVREQLRKSGAILYVISTVGAQRAAPSHAREGISEEQAQLHDDEAIESALNLGMVLGDGVRESGGHHLQVLSTTLIPTMDQLADELLNQYALTCALPSGVKLTDKLSVSSKRKGVTVRAPSRLPNTEVR